MTDIPSNGYTDYPLVPDDTELPNVPAPETLLPEYTGDITEEWLGGPPGLQPGFDVPGVSPMSPDFYAVFGSQKAS